MKKQVPKILIFSRLIIGLLILLFSYFQIEHYKTIAIVLLTTGLLTDIFDGIIARRLNISTQKLRRLDSTVDLLFFLSVAVATYIQCSDFFKTNTLKIILLVSAEGATYLISFLKFKKEIATHSIGAKIWSLLLFATLIQIVLQSQSAVLFNICFWAGMLTRLEIIAIILALKKWTNDVPSFYHSLQLRQGKEIKRHKMFNG